MKCLLMMLISLQTLVSCNKDDSNIEIKPTVNMSANIQMIVGSATFIVSLYDNSTAEAILAMLPMTMDMEDINNNEKYYDFPNSIPSASVRLEIIRNGDLMLYGSRTLVLFYKTFSSSYSYTRIGRVDHPVGLEAALGRGNVVVRFERIPKSS